ncbi:oligosaccharide repeat unit polymerase [Sporolactobacillus shoreae]|uniref:Oligosaccharide repeat unit polymerase n=1 Tax=Sporolactobacillus shoreae TaxID=1465501 RepID=A0A4Z0GRL3_9BACL|nr:O-antigen polymerase [Sporolactobacillus shoreae]TGA99815.1 oligosaccharide repeat unit polymerase [Sporolactobacillus shoreae]
MFNPFYLYSSSILIVLGVYQLNWSNLFPKMSSGLLVFLVMTVILSAYLGFLSQKQLTKLVDNTGNNIPRNISSSKSNFSITSRLLWIITLLIWIGYIIEFFYVGKIPVIEYIIGRQYDYRTFGIPTFHVLIVTADAFFAVFLSFLFFKLKKIYLLIQYIICLIPSFLIYSRFLMLEIVLCSFFVFLVISKKIKWKSWVLVALCVFILLYGFGLIGNVRSENQTNQTKNPFDSSLIMEIGGATNSFKNLPISKSFFWSYIYIASPLANLQETVNKTKKVDYQAKGLIGFVNNNFVFDFISKRVNGILGIQDKNISQISPLLTAGTVYSKSFVYLKWVGLVLMFLFIIVVNMIILFILRKSVFLIPALAILDTIMIFNLFQNMLIYSGLSFQLIYPLIIQLFLKGRKLTVDGQTI